MEEVYKLLIGIGILALGVPIGMLLVKKTKEELKSGRKWFKVIVILSAFGGLLGLVLGNDALMFSLLFIAVVTSAGLKR